MWLDLILNAASKTCNGSMYVLQVLTSKNVCTCDFYLHVLRTFLFAFIEWIVFIYTKKQLLWHHFFETQSKCKPCVLKEDYGSLLGLNFLWFKYFSRRRKCCPMSISPTFDSVSVPCRYTKHPVYTKPHTSFALASEKRLDVFDDACRSPFPPGSCQCHPSNS